MSLGTSAMPQVGETITCPHADGDYTIKVFDMAEWSTGSVLIRQEGQGQLHDLVVNKDESVKLAAILAKFGMS